MRTRWILILQSWENAFEAGIRHLKIPSDIIEKIPQRSSAGSYFLWLTFLQLPFVTCPLWLPGLRRCKMSPQHPKDVQKSTLNSLLLGFRWAGIRALGTRIGQTLGNFRSFLSAWNSHDSIYSFRLFLHHCLIMRPNMETKLIFTASSCPALIPKSSVYSSSTTNV